ncbi:hypothetical protein D3C85_1733300 [compost metagenome]
MSSETTKAGISTMKSRSLMPSDRRGPHMRWAVRTKKSRCSMRLFLSMKSRSGPAPSRTPLTSEGMLLRASGWAVSRSNMCVPTGAIT